ncbi:MAG: right-handed parallel beta-helix repeat-containing protein, partial [Candidatus Omnitrophica bacterium]|nr:right-handed parallel beta-helix repeat-containing protein [Candidatus Omnitrophota bacterium]
DEYRLKLSLDARKGNKHIWVVDSSPVRVGDGLYIYEAGNDFGTGTVARVVSINGRCLVLNVPLLDSYLTREQAVARHIFNVIVANNVSQLTIRNLKAMGSLKKGSTISSWVGNYVFFLEGADISLYEVTVEDSPADGIYVGTHGSLRLTDCRIRNIAQRGIHLAGHRGKGRIRGLVQGNIISYAGDYGLYLCDNCRGLVIKGNIISDIGLYETGSGITRTSESPPVDVVGTGILKKIFPAYSRPAGIGGVGAGGDADNIISENIIYRVKGSGLAFQRWVGENRPGRNMNVTANLIFDIFGPGIFLNGASGVLISGNQVANCQTGLVIKNSAYCHIEGNLIRNTKFGIHLYSLLPEFWTEKSVIANNTLIDCENGIAQSSFCRDNILQGNRTMKSR